MVVPSRGRMEGRERVDVAGAQEETVTVEGREERRGEGREQLELEIDLERPNSGSESAVTAVLVTLVGLERRTPAVAAAAVEKGRSEEVNESDRQERTAARRVMGRDATTGQSSNAAALNK